MNDNPAYERVADQLRDAVLAEELNGRRSAGWPSDTAPPVHGDVVDFDTTLEQQILDVLGDAVRFAC